MKTYLTRLLVLFSLVVLISCGKKEHEHHEEASTADEWPEMDSFHMVMAEAFHPFKDSANLEPAKKMSGELASSAESWQAAAMPDKVDNDEVRGKLAKLKTDAASFANQVQSGATDQDLGASLTSLHDTFHSIMEAWHGGGKHGEK